MRAFPVGPGFNASCGLSRILLHWLKRGLTRSELQARAEILDKIYVTTIAAYDGDGQRNSSVARAQSANDCCIGPDLSLLLHQGCWDLTRPLRALASLIVGITTVIGMIVYQHYSREPPTDAFTAALTVAATILAWAVTGLE
jgi:hypothetical protein